VPRYEIHDDDTGLKLLVEGDDPPPSEKEAQALINAELSFLSTNLYRGPEGRFMLDVGPSYAFRHWSDGTVKMINEMDEKAAVRKAASDRASERANKWIADNIGFGIGKTLRSPPDLWTKFYKEELADPRMPGIPLKQDQTYTEKTMLNLEPNTFLLIAHGGEHGGLSAEGGQKFTLNNVAKVIGPGVSQIQKIKNLACYGGLCIPEEFQGAGFTGVKEIEQADPTSINLQGLQSTAKGNYFVTNTVPGLWQKFEVPDSAKDFMDDGSVGSPREWQEMPIFVDPLKPGRDFIVPEPVKPLPPERPPGP